MNNYPKWWSDTITLYNKCYDRQTRHVSWFRHVIDGCFCGESRELSSSDSYVMASRVSICRIRVSDDFMPRNEWDLLDAEGKASKFTLSPGDIIIGGEIQDEIDEYVAGSRSEDLISKYYAYPTCFTVDSVRISTGNRGNEHYSARGA